MSALAKINDKLSVIEKSLKPISDEESSDIGDGFNALPLQTFEDFHSFENKIKKDAVMYKKLVSFIELIYENHTNFCIYFNLGIPYSVAREEKFKEQCRRLRS
jgi:hypothetical protein